MPLNAFMFKKKRVPTKKLAHLHPSPCGLSEFPCAPCG